MGLRALGLKSAWDSDSDDILNEFYVPALTESARYRRLAGFFSSTTFAVAARGIMNFIVKGGEMDLLVSARLSRSDVEAIRDGLEDPEGIIAKSGVREIEGLDEGFLRDNVKALAWMVAKRKLRIKIAIPLDDSGQPMDADQVENSGIFHQKVGILTDEEGDSISFSGSINETAYAWLHNIEEFKVYKGWEASQLPYFQSDVEKMNKYWNGESERTRVIEVPKAIEEKLISLAPERLEDIRVIPQRNTSPPRQVQLRDYQVEAVKRWSEAGFKGILAMATGTGKTIVALNAVRKHVPVNALVVVTVPTILLAGQWKKEVQRAFPGAVASECDSNRGGWRDALHALVDYVKTGDESSKRVFVLATYNTAASPDFGSLIGSLQPDRLCLIADEVHRAGAPYFSNVMSHDFGYRLGLSATPERFWDEEGEDRIMTFFGSVVYEYSLEEALRDKVLSEYRYRVVPAILEQDERRDYADLSAAITSKISRLLKSHPELKGMPFPRMLARLGSIDEGESSSVQALLIRRVNVLKRARNKVRALKEIVQGGGLGRCLIYCNDIAHVDETLLALSDLGTFGMRYDSTMKDEERQRSLNYLEGNHEGYLLSIHCLDEGVDIPTCDSAILVSSSKSTREFIQRRGRLLRRAEGKESASINDILVLPIDPDAVGTGITQAEFEILESELERAKLFAKTATNSGDVLIYITKLEAAMSRKVTS
ncbi:MAG: DEAD/DEAH box helicase family protein [Nitrososphaerota archaeon]|nr:DEAD/DEAH box helicase family protein [Nitrososphaerota archaeon]MDG6949952.1 DEAD/DEAH box helicase family protein [Nitrososphaerota archaeon]